MSPSEEAGYIELDSGEGLVWVQADSIETINASNSEDRSYRSMMFLCSGRMVLAQESPEQIFAKLLVIKAGNAEPVIGIVGSHVIGRDIKNG